MSEDKFDYFMKRTEADLKEIKSDVKELVSFRFKILGSATTLSILFSILTSLLVLFLKGK